MSSKKWLFQNGFSPMKKIASSEEISRSLTEPSAADSSSSSEDDNSQDRCQIWKMIQKEENVDKPGEFDIWSSILSKKTNEESSKLAITTLPYVHPLVRRSKSCLSEKSLQICTESLGSETGSDGFSSYSPSETEDSSEEEKEEKEEEEREKVEVSHEEEFQVPKQNHAVKKSSPRSFPPPLPSLHMRSHRDNGRLFIEAVSVPSQNNFSAQRENGRLVLTFAETSEEESEEEEFEEGDDEAEEFERCVKEQEHAPMLMSSGIGLALMMNKPNGVSDSNRSSKWSEKFNDVVNFKDVDVAQHSPLPPRPRSRIVPSSSGAFSAYEYYWKTKPKPKTIPSPNTFTFQHNNYSSLENNFKSCKDSRRSFLFWEPYCIAI